MSNIALAVQHLQIVYRESTAQLAAAERVHCSEHKADPSQKRYTNPTRYASRWFKTGMSKANLPELTGHPQWEYHFGQSPRRKTPVAD